MPTAATHWTLPPATAPPPPRACLSRPARRLGLWVGLAWCLGVLSLPHVTLAQMEDPGIDLPTTEARQPARFEISAGVEGRSETDIDDGGEVEELRVPVRLGYTATLSDTWRLGVRASYLYNDFDFSGNSGFGAIDPWEDIHLVRFALPLTYRFSPHWQIFVAPILALSAESGADLDDSVTGGGVAGFIWTATPSISIGLAVVVLSQIEEEGRLVLLPIINWQITPEITVQTEIDVSLGYGGTLAYRVAPSWQLKGGFSFKRTRFRLDTATGWGKRLAHHCGGASSLRQLSTSALSGIAA